MNELFQTYTPADPVLSPYVDYYYRDRKPANQRYAYDCYPHWNTTLSLYASHRYHAADRAVDFVPGGRPLQIFTPLRTDVLRVQQWGPVSRLVIVFHPLGVQRFFGQLAGVHDITPAAYLPDTTVHRLLEDPDWGRGVDDLLQERILPDSSCGLEEVVAVVLTRSEVLSAEALAQLAGCGRRQLNRRFRTHLGVSVREFLGIVRFRRTVRQQLAGPNRQRLTDLAYRHDFADQSHLVKTFQRWAAAPPGAFFRQGIKLGDRDTFWRVIEEEGEHSDGRRMEF